jgi:hypothetical protein
MGCLRDACDLDGRGGSLNLPFSLFAPQSKFNITIGHTAALAELTFFGLPPTANPAVWTLEEVMTMARQHLMVLTLKDSKAPDFNVTGEYLYQVSPLPAHKLSHYFAGTDDGSPIIPGFLGFTIPLM